MQLEALALQLRTQLAKVVAGASKKIALTAPAQIGNPTGIGSGQLLEGGGQRFFRRKLGVLLALPVADDHFSLGGNVPRPHLVGHQIRIHEAQRDVGLIALIALQQLQNGLPDHRLLSHVGCDLDCVVQARQQCTARLGQCISAGRGPVPAHLIVLAQPGEHADDSEQQYYERRRLRAGHESRGWSVFHGRLVPEPHRIEAPYRQYQEADNQEPGVDEVRAVDNPLKQRVEV